MACIGVFLKGEDLTPAMKAALFLPPDAWQVVINETCTCAAFMDRDCQVHHIAVDDVKRDAVLQLIDREFIPDC